MSLLLSDKVWVMLSEVAKRGIYPTHGAKLGIYRLPVDLYGQSEMSGIMNELKSFGYTLDTFADRVFVTKKWVEKEFDIFTNQEQSAELYVTVEIVTGEVLDLIYQIRPIEAFGDFYWVKNYRQKADINAKIIIDNILRNTKIGQKLIGYYQKIQKLSQEEAIKKLEQITPLANSSKNLADDKKPLTASSPPPQNASQKLETPVAEVSPPQPQAETPVTVPLSENTTLQLTGTGTNHTAAEGPIDVGFKSSRQPAGKFQGIQVWGPYDAPGQLGIWGTDVCVDFDICVSDGACIDACPVNVYEWLDTPGHPASERKPFMIREKDCIFCLACENVCPPQAIKIFKK
ncbi:4Fe-4S dicluster domain-containing protein [Candidatus Nitrosocosmicus agrestis]|jgi:NAD-dependent dihydropyrimidine dehydrogenase PreA subunit|uniref:4Fe-4S dicluster domain-containing protein n=1 Tax=Candidatus Nitrosocosmicus agrestis TaxID=2563600 RepID=UPI00122E2508|nr:4Fe-4S binding protein [Candidatus Nitrosocosmicus sp. SS]KAA2282165.1 4Fe-4S dicluster domain-containing protein [Candidatus Nitrosocosmicus sp. SS]KAF0869989.1 4Fe-4S dicluster domain-containing protein [Candidatus Nitrosocosmicus sp. SS]MDR4492625.1 4Fe-4S binding protein [Candidatus Nitrosocosmicus sp.]